MAHLGNWYVSEVAIKELNKQLISVVLTSDLPNTFQHDHF